MLGHPPWDAIIQASAYGSSDPERGQWWFQHAVHPLLKFPNHNSQAQQLVDDLEGAPPSDRLPASAAVLSGLQSLKGNQSGPGLKKQARKRAPKLDTFGPEVAAKRAKETCNLWNKGGCAAVCPHGRRHACERCGGPDPAVRCACTRPKR